ncbi:MAG: hypothetical protein A2V66_08415 [Ignavibacteria bacterium RBG_13_36_8]|nr:MAG: hypothetical protein A2V66_08415 [Ignavibacteria bacterium RBG_13_36_8]
MQSNFSKTRLYNLLKQRRKHFVFIPTIIYWIILFVLTSIPSNALPSPFGISDKVEHFIAYLILSIFIAMSLHFQKAYTFLSRHFFLTSIVITTFYGIFDEFHQYYIPGRYCELWDIAANICGVLSGTLIGLYFINTQVQNKLD